jgi:hypothetical protein
MFHPSKSNKPRRVLHLCIHCYNSFLFAFWSRIYKSILPLEENCLWEFFGVFKKDVEDLVVKVWEDLKLKERTYDRIDEARKENSSSARKRKIGLHPWDQKRWKNFSVEFQQRILVGLTSWSSRIDGSVWGKDLTDSHLWFHQQFWGWWILNI